MQVRVIAWKSTIWRNIVIVLNNKLGANWTILAEFAQTKNAKQIDDRAIDPSN